MSLAPVQHRRALRPGVEYEFDSLAIPREFSRAFVTRLLTDRAEYGGWGLDRLRVGAEGGRRLGLPRRRIVRQRVWDA